MSAKHNSGTIEIEPPPKVRNDNVEEWSQSAWMAGFWWVGTSSDKAACNMEDIGAKEEDVSFRCYTNRRIVKKYEVLIIYKAKEEKGSEKKTSAEPVAKKARH